MTISLPEPIKTMLQHADDTLAAGDAAKAETEYLFAFDYASKVFHELSPVTGLVLLRLTRFYEQTNQKHKAAIALGRTNAIITAHLSS